MSEDELISKIDEQGWTMVIEARRRLFDLRLGELWRYRDLVMLFVRRDFVSVYKQTILGPLWYLIQPILTTVTFTFIFGNIAEFKNTIGDDFFAGFGVYGFPKSGFIVNFPDLGFNGISRIQWSGKSAFKSSDFFRLTRNQGLHQGSAGKAVGA